MLLNQMLWFIFCLIFSGSAFSLQIYRTGQNQDITVQTKSLTCLAGGGYDEQWIMGWKKLIASAAGGDVVIIRADGERGEYESWIYFDTDHHGFAKVNSVSTLVLSQRADANHKKAIELIQNAELVFFAGGDQSEYNRIMRGSQLHKALNHYIHKKKRPIGGTSAGMAILGDIDFIARFPVNEEVEIVRTHHVLANPTARYVDLKRGFITPRYLKNVITDSHFSERLRQGRLVGFMANAVYREFENVDYSSVRGVGVDEGTAVCIKKSGQAKVYGVGSAHFLTGMTPIERIAKGASLNWFGEQLAVHVYSIKGEDSPQSMFDFKEWIGFGGEEKYWYIDGRDPALTPLFGEKK